FSFFFFQAEDGIRDFHVTGVHTCALPIFADAARAIYWFNPLFWILSRRLRRESEHAADNAALGLGIDRADYAEALLEISRFLERSEERRVGKGSRSRGSPRDGLLARQRHG